MKRILVLSPHPDDESIGCGGTISRHVAEGDQVHVLFLTCGEKGGHGRSESVTAELREKEARAAAKILGIERTEFLRLPDGALRADATLVGSLSEKIRKWKPQRIYLPHGQESHADHRVAFRALRRALSDRGNSKSKPEVLMFEIWTPLQVLDEIVDITPYVDVKRAAIQKHVSQCQVVGFDEAILGLNRYRGEMHCWPEGEYAEVFQRLKYD